MSAPRGTPHPMHDPKWRRYLRFFRPDPAADFEDELRDHLESTVESLVARGMSRDDALHVARERLGDLTRVRREVSRMDRSNLTVAHAADWFAALRADVRFALRAFLRSPGFVAVAVLSIALAVAANSTVFSVVNSLLFRPLPGSQSDRLVRLYVNRHSPFTYPDLAWFREHAKTLEAVAGERYTAMGMRVGSEPATERVRVSMVTRGFFDVFGVAMALGRSFAGDERSADGAVPVAVLAHDFWTSRFGADSGVVGRTILIAEHPVTIVGIAAPEFRSSLVGRAPNLFLPAAAAQTLTGTPLERIGGSFYTTARLARDATPAHAEREMRVLMLRLAATDSARYDGMTVRVGAIRGIEEELRQAVQAGSAFMMAMVAVVLLIACANVANLLLGRAASRQGEIGVRMALGASRARIVRQLLTESFLLAAAGSVVGLAVAFVVTRLFGSMLPAEAGTNASTFAPDRNVLLFTLLACVATTLLFGLVPALRASSPHVVPLLKGDAPRRRRRRGALIASQVALSVLMLAVAAHFWRSLSRMRGLDNGFQADGVVDVTVDLSLAATDTAAYHATFARLLQRARALPGVQSATLAAQVPLTGSTMETRVVPEGMEGSSRFDFPLVAFNEVSSDYFQTLRIPLLGGRGFTREDDAGTRRVIVVNETAAARWWPGAQPVGKRIRFGGVDAEWAEVVGVARDADYGMPGEDARAVVYVPYHESNRRDLTLQLRTSSTPASLRDAVWGVLRTELPALPPPPVVAMREEMGLTLLPVQTGAALLGVLGAIALLLAATGIYGVTAYAVASRTREIGVRTALGATRARIVRLIVRDSLRPVSVGLLIGAALSTGAAFGLGRVLFGISPFDVRVAPPVVALLLIVATVAALVPARRASRVEPTIAMRSES